MNTPRRWSALLAAGLLTLAACGGDDEPVPAPDETEDADTGAAEATDGGDDTADTADAGDDAPSATISPDLPDDFIEAVRPVEVIGDALPPMPTDGGPDSAFGMPAPILVGEDYSGDTVRADAVNGGPTMLVFLAHWCSHCNDEIPQINALRDAGAFPPGLRIIGVSTGFRPDLPNYPPGEWLEQKDWTYPVIADNLDLSDPASPRYVAADAYGLTGFPMIALVGDDGTLAARWSGERGPEIIDLIDQYLDL